MGVSPSSSQGVPSSGTAGTVDQPASAFFSRARGSWPLGGPCGGGPSSSPITSPRPRADLQQG
eukprot:6043523-Lingulodinium_polyedra.AAC.1